MLMTKLSCEWVLIQVYDSILDEDKLFVLSGDCLIAASLISGMMNHECIAALTSLHLT